MGFTPSAVVAALDTPAAVLDAAGNVVAVNVAWQVDPGYPVGPGAPFVSAWGPRGHPVAAEALAAAIRGTPVESGCPLPDGTRGVLRIAPLPAEDGARHLLASLRADRRQPHGFESFGDEKWFRTLVAALDEGFLLLDADGKVLACNAAAERILQAASADLERDLERPWQLIRPDGTPFPPDQRPSAQTIRAGLAYSDVVMGVRRADGTVTWLSVNARPLLRAGDPAPYAVVVSFADITERRLASLAARRSERRLGALVAGLPSGILVVSQDQTAALVNEEFCRLFGLTGPPVRLVGTDCRRAGFALPLAADPAGFSRRAEQLQAGGCDVRGETLPLRDGRTVEYDVITVDIGEGGRETLWVFRDITAHTMVERELAAARDQALAASSAKSEFLATLSHEVRTPMSGIVGMVDLLLSLPLDDDIREVVDGVRLSADALTGMLNDMIDLARIEVGRLQLDERPFEVSELVEGVAETLGSRARQKGLALVVHVADDVPGRVVGDDARLRQALLNLVGNAVKFTEAGEVVVSVSADQGPDGPALLLEVLDTGPGMTAQTLAIVFEPFVQEDSSIARKHGGSGLGLAISARLVRLMGGQVRAESVPSVGSRFSVRLPLVPAVDGDAAPGAWPLAGRRLLVTGPDMPRSSAALAGVLRSEGARVDVVRAADLRDVVGASDRNGQAVHGVVWVADGRDAGTRSRAAALAATLPAGARLVLLSRTDPARGHPSGVTVLSLPVRRGRLVEAVGGPPAARDTAAPVRPRPAGHRVLLAEDDGVNRTIVARMLDLLGVRVDAVADGAAAVDAVALAAAEPYGAVLMDVQMPGTDGLAATRLIRAAEGDRHTPIVALTANAMGGERQTYLAAGMDDYLAKPVRLSALRSMLERHLPAGTGSPGGVGLAESRLDELEEQLQDPVLVATTVELYLTELPGRSATLAAAADRGDRAALRAAAHTLKSSSAMLGAEAVAELCRRLEATADDADTDELRLAAAEVRRAAAQAEVAMRRYVQRLRSAR